MDTTNLPEAALRTVTRPFTSAATAISGWVEDSLDRLVNADRYKRENDELRRQISEYISEIMDKDALIQENERLKEILGIIEEHPDFSLSPPSSVIARDSMNVSGNFTISRGSNSAIKKDDPVISEVGLIGIITETAPTYSRVTTILSNEINVGVRTESGKAMGVIENDLVYSSKRLCLMRYIDKDSGIAVGDIIVTSGGSMFPAGLFVGTVSEVFPDENGLSLNAVIEPAEDVFRNSDVFVITSFEGQGVTP
ncbi:MAG: rod shape-determining protein MreC [Oscillospiraceae bacterium]|nr:rod shape-determining protein MreC [Oscillospiraceae bacterium]